MQAGKGSVTGRAGEPKENLDGFLARLHRFPRNEGRATTSAEPNWNLAPSSRLGWSGFWSVVTNLL